MAAWLHHASREIVLFALPYAVPKHSYHSVIVVLIHIGVIPCALISVVSGDPYSGITPNHVVLPRSQFPLVPRSLFTTRVSSSRLTVLLKIVML